MRWALLFGFVPAATVFACSSFDSSNEAAPLDASVQDASSSTTTDPDVHDPGDAAVDGATRFCTGKPPAEFCADWEHTSVNEGWSLSPVLMNGAIGFGPGSSSTRGILVQTQSIGAADTATAELRTLRPIATGPITLAFDVMIDHADPAGFVVANIDFAPDTANGNRLSVAFNAAGHFILFTTDGGNAGGSPQYDKIHAWGRLKLVVSLDDASHVSATLADGETIVVSGQFSMPHGSQIRLELGVIATSAATAHQVGYDNVELVAN